jgi:hypothetical protein
MLKATALAAVGIALLVQEASAYSREVRRQCRDDYFAHCSNFAVGDPALRACMRKVGKRLSPSCIGALKASGEVAKERRGAKAVRD